MSCEFLVNASPKVMVVMEEGRMESEGGVVQEGLEG